MDASYSGKFSRVSMLNAASKKQHLSHTLSRPRMHCSFQGRSNATSFLYDSTTSFPFIPFCPQ